MTVDHYENFPVASVLCPPALRPAVQAIYRFARTADDIADEGDATGAERRTRLDAYEQMLLQAAAGRVGGDWPEVFRPLARQIEAHRLPLALLRDLICAFRQDTHNPIYPDRAALLDYCSRSANPIGRLLLHLCAIDPPEARAQSDAVCSALQLINFWQDLSIDLPRGRCYVTQADARRHGLDVAAFAGAGGAVRVALCDSAAPRDQMSASAASRGLESDSAASRALVSDSAASRALVRELCAWARALMREGQPLVHRLPGRFGWELRFVVQGGLRVLDKIEARGFNALSHRPTVGAADAPLLAWRALRMRRLRHAALVHDRA
jgi:hydroxysqualene synthase